jgi:Tfp pilus assembly pilus retraction ATPase PilT
MIRNLISESLQAVICQTLVNTISGGRAAAGAFFTRIN